MPDVRSMYDKEFLYAFDLQGRDVTVTIAKVTAGKLTGKGGKSNKKPVLYFQGKEKGLGLNITNARTIAAMYGGFDSEKWIGKRVTLYATTTQFGSDTVECIRIRPTVPGAKEKNAPADPLPVEREPGEDRGDEPSDEEYAKAGL